MASRLRARALGYEFLVRQILRSHQLHERVTEQVVIELAAHPSIMLGLYKGEQAILAGSHSHQSDYDIELHLPVEFVSATDSRVGEWIGKDAWMGSFGVLGGPFGDQEAMPELSDKVEGKMKEAFGVGWVAAMRDTQ